jgi:crossover junction endodeoxyribonuclease RuvC
MSTFLGIDIGAKGALALIDSDLGLIDVADMPILRDGPNSRPTVSAPLLADIVREWRPTAAFVEFVGARPGEGPSGAFAFGRSRGIVEGVLGAIAVPTSWITAPSWKRAIGIPPGKDGAKDAARAEAIRRWPARAEFFARVKDDGRAEACLIAVAGMMRRRA